MIVQTNNQKYTVSFCLNRDTAKAKTTCSIYLINRRPEFISQGTALQGKTDKFNLHTGMRWAFKRAMAATDFPRPVRIAFWKEFDKMRWAPSPSKAHESFYHRINQLMQVDFAKFERRLLSQGGSVSRLHVRHRRMSP
jgi:hypothetical protein